MILQIKIFIRLCGIQKFHVYLRKYYCLMKIMPFIFGKTSDLVNFTDREEECLRLEMNFKSLVNTMPFYKFEGGFFYI